MTIILDKPEQIAMWALLSRRAQIKLHLKGYPVKGLLKWLKANIDGCENASRIKQCVVPLEYAIAEAGGPQDFSIVNVHVMREIKHNGSFLDCGIYSDMAEVEANPGFVSLYRAGSLEIVYTLDEPREPNGQLFSPA